MNSSRSRKIEVLPHSIEIEHAILCTILLDNNKIQLCIEQNLKPEHFYLSYTKALYTAMLSLSNKGIEIDVITTSEEAASLKLIKDKSSAMIQIAEIASYLPMMLSNSVLRRYIETLKGYAKRREYMHIAEQIKLIAAEEEDLNKINSFISETLLTTEENSNILTAKDILRTETDTVEIFVHGVKIATRSIWGIVGATSAGKTEFMLDVSYSFADLSQNRSVLFCQYEGTKEDMALRIKRKVGKWAKKPIYIAMKPTFTEIVNFVRKHKEKNILIIIDYLQRFARQLQDNDKNAKDNLRMYVNKVYAFFDRLRQDNTNISVCFLMSMSKEGIREAATQEYIDASTILNAIKESGDVQYDLDYSYAMLFTNDRKKLALGRFTKEGKTRKYMVLRPIKEARIGEKLKEEIYTFSSERNWYEKLDSATNTSQMSGSQNTIEENLSRQSQQENDTPPWELF